MISTTQQRDNMLDNEQRKRRDTRSLLASTFRETKLDIGLKLLRDARLFNSLAVEGAVKAEPFAIHNLGTSL